MNDQAAGKSAGWHAGPYRAMATIPTKNQSRSKIWRQIARAWILLVCGHFAWEALSYRCLYAISAEWQIANFGGYVPVLTYAFWAFLFSLPGLIIARRSRERQVKAMSLGQEFAASQAFGKRVMAFLFFAAFSLMAAAAGTALWAQFALPTMAGPVQTISLGDPNAKHPVEGPTRLVGGVTGRPAIFGQFWFLGDKYIAYAPYLESGPTSNQSSFFVQLRYLDRKTLRAEVNAPVWNGLLVRDGLPGTIRALFRGIGYRVPDSYFTLYASEIAMRYRYWAHAIQMAIGSLLPLILALFQRRHLRKARESFAEMTVSPVSA